jgi:hypothetical protein
MCATSGVASFRFKVAAVHARPLWVESGLSVGYDYFNPVPGFIPSGAARARMTCEMQSLHSMLTIMLLMASAAIALASSAILNL